MGKGSKDKPLASIGRFLAVPHRVIRSKAYQQLSHTAARLLWDIAGQYMGRNNGQLRAGYGPMSEIGWKSAGTLHKARQELMNAGFIYQTVMGYRPNKASWYAITWQPLDKLSGYDFGVEKGFKRWAFENSSLNPINGPTTAAIRPVTGLEQVSPRLKKGSVLNEKLGLPSPEIRHHLEMPSVKH